MDKATRKRSGCSGWAYLLLVIPIFAILWVPFYAREEPAWMGIPFFYWHQTLWVVLSTATMGVVYRLIHRKGR